MVTQQLAPEEKTRLDKIGEIIASAQLSVTASSELSVCQGVPSGTRRIQLAIKVLDKGLCAAFRLHLVRRRSLRTYVAGISFLYGGFIANLQVVFSCGRLVTIPASS